MSSRSHALSDLPAPPLQTKPASVARSVAGGACDVLPPDPTSRGLPLTTERRFNRSTGQRVRTKLIGRSSHRARRLLVSTCDGLGTSMMYILMTVFCGREGT